MNIADRPPMPDWPALMDEDLAADYCGRVAVTTFRGLVARAKVRPVDMGFDLVRWRRVDLDRMIDRLPARGAKIDQDQAVNDAQPVADPQTALERAAKRSRR